MTIQRKLHSRGPQACDDSTVQSASPGGYDNSGSFGSARFIPYACYSCDQAGHRKRVSPKATTNFVGWRRATRKSN